jgi:hypothetical protein
VKKMKDFVVFDKSGRFKGGGIKARVWESAALLKWRWETDLAAGIGSYRNGFADTRAEAERAAKDAIPALARRTLRYLKARVKAATKESAKAIARHEAASKKLAGWVTR